MLENTHGLKMDNDKKTRRQVVLPQACPPGGGHELFLVLETLKVDGQELGAGNLEQKGETFEPIRNAP